MSNTFFQGGEKFSKGASPPPALSLVTGLLVDQSPEESETEWLCVDVAGYKIINAYKLPRLQFTPTAIPTFPSPTPWVTSQADITCRSPEAACWLRLGCFSTTLRTATLALVHSTAEYCAPVWWCSAHTRLIDPPLTTPSDM